MQDVTHRDTCRLCGSHSFELVLPILPSAIGDAFVTKDQLDEKQGVYPLDTYLCLDCGLLQNLDIVNPDLLFRNYTYRTSASLGLVEHFRKYAGSVVEGLGIPKNSLVAEIGSNDGSLLKAFKALGMRVQGVDPARTIAGIATSEGVPTVPDFFTSAVADDILSRSGKASLVCANNVFAHADGMEDIVSGIRKLLTDDGAFVFEVSYAPYMADNMVFDVIYHEHVSHYAIAPLEKFFNRLDMTFFDVEAQMTKGGSIRGFAQPKSTGKRPRSQRLLDMMAEEERRGVTKPQMYRDFYNAVQDRKKQTLDYLDAQIAGGKTVAAYGASTTTTTLMYHFELGSRVSFIVDDNPVKHGTYSPGLHIPVYPSSELSSRRPDVVVILAWTYWEPIAKRNAQFIAEGGEFLVPLPNFRLINKDKS